MARLIDPTVARAVARRIAGQGSAEGSYLTERLQQDLVEAVPLAERLVAEASGIPAPAPVPWRLIDRAEWADANIEGMTSLLRPLAEMVESRLEGLPLTARLVQRALVSVEVGVLLGYVSRRVLGQYDLLVPERATALPPRRRRRGGPSPPRARSSISWLPTSSRPSAASASSPGTSLSGWPCTRSRTASSSTACPGSASVFWASCAAT